MNVTTLSKIIREHGMITHAGSYHADDVLATILINVLINDDQDPFDMGNQFIYPTRCTGVPDNYQGFVYDIGGGKFDHHQPDAARRINGHKYSAIGLIWKAFGGGYVQKVLGTKESKIVTSTFRSIDRYFQYIDLTDNVGLGEAFNNISASITAMSQCGVPFETTVNTCAPLLITFIKVEIENAKKMIEAAELANACKEDFYVIPDGDPYIPAKVFYGTHIRFVLSRSNREGYNINAVPGNKIEVPKDELSGCTFLHEGKFMAVFDTKESALIAIGKIVAKK